ncbi:MAG: AEC family transporter [Hydrogenophaga sp.]|uniref:AEC family transporter n=1 Tax=Hydrogenophaga sp. TaxID=1904254 RepID=UPI00257F2D3C|nr:AEC family transporter [Hydrogenophaga sp.]MBL0944522.1 AEC family transporter [Hydrogenophaga sp.]
MNLASHPVFVSLTPVFLLVGLGFMAGRLQWIREAALKDLSNLVFMVLIPALLFRTMSAVRFEQLDLRPMLAYFPSTLLLLGLCVWRHGATTRSVVLGLAATFSNMVMIGITLIELAYGKQGLVTLLTLVSVHALIQLSVGSIVLELIVAREARAQGGEARRLWATVGSVARGTLIHPIPLPIISGLLFAQTGWALPGVVDKPLQLLGSAFGPIALVLVGVSLAATPLKGHWRAALEVVAAKNLLLPLMVAVGAWSVGVTGLPLTVVVVTAALPVGANVFLFAQRYQTAQELTTATMGLSTLAAPLTLSLVMGLMAWLN